MKSINHAIQFITLSFVFFVPPVFAESSKRDPNQKVLKLRAKAKR